MVLGCSARVMAMEMASLLGSASESTCSRDNGPGGTGGADSRVCAEATIGMRDDNADTAAVISGFLNRR